MSFIKFIFIILIFLLHLFIYFVIFRNLSTEPIIRHIGKIIVFINFVLIIVFFSFYRNKIDASATLYMILSSSIGIFWITLCISIILSIIFVVMHYCCSIFTIYKIAPILSAFAICIIVILSTFSFYQNKDIAFPQTNIEVKNIKNLKVALMADLHINILMDWVHVKNIVEQLNAQNVDIAILAGDIIDCDFENNENAKAALDVLKNIHTKYGIYYALGNHEYYHDYKNVVSYLKDSNIKILQDENVLVDINNNEKINIVGLNDIRSLKLSKNMDNGENKNRLDLNRAFAQVEGKYPVIVISHQPKIITMLDDRKYEVIDLILSGHTHSGQIFPFNFFVKLDQPFVRGLHHFKIFDKESQIFITQGAGWWGMPMRLGTNREINILTLNDTSAKNTNNAPNIKNTSENISNKDSSKKALDIKDSKESKNKSKKESTKEFNKESATKNAKVHDIKKQNKESKNMKSESSNKNNKAKNDKDSKK